jgi:hypothetical protein
MGRLTLRRRLLLALLGAFLALTLTTVVFPARMSGESAPSLGPITPGGPPILPVFPGIAGFDGQPPTTPMPTARLTAHAV